MARTTITRKLNIHDPAVLPGWVSALPLWQWYAIPNTALSSVEPSNIPSLTRQLTGPRSKIDSWCGATLRRKGSVYLLGAAGGHADYAGNEVNALALNTETPQWVELRAQSSVENVYNQATAYGDLRCAAMHTYWATQYDQVRDRMLIVADGGMNSGNLPAPPTGWSWPISTGVMFAFDWATKDWLPPDTLARITPSGGGTAAAICSNSATGEIYRSRAGESAVSKYDPATDKWASAGSTRFPAGYEGSAIDPTRRKMLKVGSFEGTLAPVVWNLDTQAVEVATFSGLGAAALTITGYPGIVFDEANDCFLVFNNSSGSIDIIRVDPQTWAVDRPSITGSVAARPNGIHNAVQYVPELKGVVIANSYSGNMQFMRTVL